MNKMIQILIVEDEVLIAEWLKFQLEEEGYQVYNYITTGEETIEFVKKTKPDVILMDINLAGEIDGIKTAEEITKRSKIPIIFISGYEDSKIFEARKKIDPKMYLTKPVEMCDLKKIFDVLFK